MGQIENGIDLGYSPLVVPGGSIMMPIQLSRVTADVRHIYFANRYPSGRLDIDDECMPRISYQPTLDDETTKFVGMKVPPCLEGKGYGTALLQWLVDETEAFKTPLTHTSVIRKPGIALLLQKQGFEPVDTNCEAVITSRDKKGVPTIKWLHQTLPHGRRIERSPAGAYYHTKGPTYVHDRFVPEDVDESRVVFLHTRFRRPGLQASALSETQSA